MKWLAPEGVVSKKRGGIKGIFLVSVGKKQRSGGAKADRPGSPKWEPQGALLLLGWVFPVVISGPKLLAGKGKIGDKPYFPHYCLKGISTPDNLQPPPTLQTSTATAYIYCTPSLHRLYIDSSFRVMQILNPPSGVPPRFARLSRRQTLVAYR